MKTNSNSQVKKPKSITTIREEATTAIADFHAGPLSWSKWNLQRLVSAEGGKPPEVPEEKPSEQKTKST